MEHKTVINVKRTTTKSRKKAWWIFIVVLIIMMASFVGLDFHNKWTIIGQNLYFLINPISLKIDSLPTGALVIFDGTPLQYKTPVKINKIHPGTHQIMLSLDNLSPVEKFINISHQGKIYLGKEIIHSKRTVLIRFKKEIRMDSEPQGATVFINDKKYPQLTPFSYKAEIGVPLSLTMQLKGYGTLSKIFINPISGSENISLPTQWSFTALSNTANVFLLKGNFRAKSN